jgi:hypothetical protein
MTTDFSDSPSAAETFQRYQRPIVIGAVLLAAAGGGLWMAKRSGEIKEQRAQEAFAVAEAAYSSGGIPAAQAELQKVLTRYAGTSAGSQAALLSTQWYYEAGQADSGLAVVSAAVAKAPAAMRAGMLGLQATGKALKGDHSGAAKDFEAAAAASQLPTDRDAYRMDAARSYMTAGDAAAAERIYTEISLREDSDFAGEARLRLGEIKAKA